MNEVKLNSSVYRWFRYETCCFLTRDIQPCLGNESIYCVSCKVCYTIVLVCTCIWTNLCQMLYKKGLYLFANACFLLLSITIFLGYHLFIFHIYNMFSEVKH